MTFVKQGITQYAQGDSKNGHLINGKFVEYWQTQVIDLRSKHKVLFGGRWLEVYDGARDKGNGRWLKYSPFVIDAQVLQLVQTPFLQMDWTLGDINAASFETMTVTPEPAGEPLAWRLWVDYVLDDPKHPKGFNENKPLFEVQVRVKGLVKE